MRGLRAKVEDVRSDAPPAALMVLQASLRIRHAGCVTESFTGETYAAQISADRGGDLIVVHNADPKSIDGLIEAFRRGSALPPEVVERVEGAALFRAKNPPGGIISTIVDAGAFVLLPVVYTGGYEYFTVIVTDASALESLLSRLRRFGDVAVERQTIAAPEALPILVPLSDLTSDLSGKQLHVLQSAIDCGYYERPRRTTMREHARRMGLSPSTVEEHRRKAEESILHRFGEVIRRHPVLMRMALKKAGRPRGKGQESGRAGPRQ